MGFRGDTSADRTARVIGVGSLVSGHRVQGVVGSGGMGTVYAVIDPQLPRLDALKVLPAELSSDTEFRTRFQREADIAAGLDHPNIVSVYDRGETADGRLWIALQLVDGTATVGEALDYAHSRKVLHRDIKPANFVLSGPIGADERVLLGDFGIARAADEAGMTATDSIVATMAYAAPEVLDGRTVDDRADLYSLGCALFHLLSGQPPYADARGMAAPVPGTELPGLLLSAEQTSAVMGLDLQAQQTPITGYAQIFNPAEPAIKVIAAQAVTAYSSPEPPAPVADQGATIDAQITKRVPQ